MVNSVTNSTTNTTVSTQGTTSTAPASGVQSPFAAVKQTVGGGVGAGAAALAMLKSSQLTGLNTARQNIAAGEMATTGDGLLPFTESQMGKLKTRNTDLQAEINTLETDKNLNLDNYKNTPRDKYNGGLLDALVTLDKDTNADPSVSDGQLAADQKAVDDERAKLTKTVQPLIDADNQELKDNNATLKNQAASLVDGAREELAGALKPFFSTDSQIDASLATRRENERAAANHAANFGKEQVIQQQADRERAQQQGATLASSQVVATEQERRLQQTFARGWQARDVAIRTLQAAGASLTAGELEHLERTGEPLPDGVLPREGGRGNRADQPGEADDATQGSANAQGAVAFANASGSTANGNAVDGRATATVAASQHDNPFDDGVNPLGDDPDFFGLNENPLEIAPDASMKQGVGGDVVQLVADGGRLLNELNKLSDMLHKLGVPGGALSRGLPYYLAVSGDQNRMRVPV